MTEAALECRRGQTIATTQQSPRAHKAVVWKPTTEASVLTKATVRTLHEEGALPDPHDLLLVRMRPDAAATEWSLTVRVKFAGREPAERVFPFEADAAKLNEEGTFSAAFLFAHGPEDLGALSFPYVFVVDATEGAGHAPMAEVLVPGAEPITIQLGDGKPPEPTPEKLLACVCIPGGTFEFDSSFVRPSVAEAMQEVDAVLAKHPEGRLFIVAHTDRVGSEQYNKDLSDRRAYSAYAFIVDDADAWELLYTKESWGLRTVQIILQDLGHDPGPIDGKMGPLTQRAMRSFLGVPEGTPVANDPPFRKKLFLAYMQGKRDVKVTEDRFISPKFTGCGEFNPLVPPNAAELANTAPGNEPNRRVVLYVFSEDAPVAPCQLQDTAPCRAELAKPKERGIFPCAFYDSIATKCGCEVKDPPPKVDPVPPAEGKAKLAVRVLKEGDPNRPVAGALVALLKLPEKQPSGAFNTGPNGSVSGIELEPGKYSIQVKSQDPNLTDASIQVELKAGESRQVTVSLFRKGQTATKGFLVVQTLKDGTPAGGVSVRVQSEEGKPGGTQVTASSGAALFELDPGSYIVFAVSLSRDAVQTTVVAGKTVHVTLGDGKPPIPPQLPPSDVPWQAYFNESFEVCHNSWMMQKLAEAIIKGDTSFPGGKGSKIAEILKKIIPELEKKIGGDPNFKLPPAKVAVAACMRETVRNRVKNFHGEGHAAQTDDRLKSWLGSPDGQQYHELPDK